MVLVRFDLDKILGFSGLSKDEIIATPWLLGGEAREEGDKVVMEFNPDRPDLYSIQGVTRAVRQYLGKEKFKKLQVEETSLEISSMPPPERRFFAACIVKQASIQGLLEYVIDYQEKLHVTIARNRKKSAIGLHDLRKVRFPLKYTSVSGDRDFKPLGEAGSRKISDFMKENEKAKEFGGLVGERIPAIIDGNGEIISLPPILNSSITEMEPGTEDVFIDVTGTDRNTVWRTLVLMATALSYPSGTISTIFIDNERLPDLEYEVMDMPSEGVKRILGYEVKEQEIRASLERMGYLVEERVTVPPYRVDILGAVDIVEDVLKGIGFQNVRKGKVNFQHYGAENRLRTVEERIRRLLVGYDLTETVSSVLVNSTFNKLYGIVNPKMKIVNPVSQEQDSVRTMITPSLFQTFLNNLRNPYPQRIFEIGTVYDEEGESEVLGIGIADRNASFSQIKGLVVGVLEDLGVVEYEITRGEMEVYVPGRVGEIRISGRKVGFFGEVHPKILKDLGIKMPVVTGEIKLELIVK
ncbi:MAG: phenylalanine--tRNA ligase subunit beta [Thermoplasmata archaeon]